MRHFTLTLQRDDNQDWDVGKYRPIRVMIVIKGNIKMRQRINHNEYVFSAYIQSGHFEYKVPL